MGGTGDSKTSAMSVLPSLQDRSTPHTLQPKESLDAEYFAKAPLLGMNLGKPLSTERKLGSSLDLMARKPTS